MPLAMPDTEVRLTVWGDKATQNPEQWEANPVVAIKVRTPCRVANI